MQEQSEFQEPRQIAISGVQKLIDMVCDTSYSGGAHARTGWSQRAGHQSLNHLSLRISRTILNKVV